MQYRFLRDRFSGQVLLCEPNKTSLKPDQDPRRASGASHSAMVQVEIEDHIFVWGGAPDDDLQRRVKQECDSFAGSEFCVNSVGVSKCVFA